MMKYFCDRCDEEMERMKYVESFTIPNPEFHREYFNLEDNNELDLYRIPTELHLCDKCAKAYEKFCKFTDEY